MMKQTRIETQALKAAVQQAVELLDKTEQLLAPYLVTLTDADRASALRPRDGFDKGARALARGAAKYPDLAKVVGFDAPAVTEDLDNAEAIVPLAERADRLNRLVADSRLAWLAEAYMPSLALYNVAKVKAKSDGAVSELLQPIAELFATARTKKTVG